MYELTVKARRDLERAAIRAQAQKPKIEEIGLGMYKVFSTNPQTPWLSYSTGVEPAPNGDGYSVCCSCPTTRFFCKHLAAIFPHYLMRVKQLENQEAAALAVPAPVPAAPVVVDYTADQAAFDRACLFG